jgi:hypothetical protein
MTWDDFFYHKPSSSATLQCKLVPERRFSPLSEALSETVDLDRSKASDFDNASGRVGQRRARFRLMTSDVAALSSFVANGHRPCLRFLRPL